MVDETKNTPEDTVIPKYRPANRKNMLNELIVLNGNDKLMDLKKNIIETFKEQMRLRKKLLSIDGCIMKLGLETDVQNNIISEWEAKNGKLYKNQRNSAQWYSNYNSEVGTDDKELGDLAVQKAINELNYIEKKQERYMELRTTTERELETCKGRANLLEADLPSKISSQEERELIRLIIRVHELEIEKMAMQSERMIKQHELKQRDMMIMRYERQRQICEEIITRQRQLIEEGRMTLPIALQELYLLYQQEIHSSTYVDTSDPSYNALSANKLPQIQPRRKGLGSSRIGSLDNGLEESDGSMQTPASSAESDWMTSPASGGTYSGGTDHSPGITPASVLFPPIMEPVRKLRLEENHRNPTASRLPRPIPRVGLM